MRSFLTVSLVIACLTSVASSQSAATLPARDDVLAVMRKTCDYQLEQQRTTPFNNGWIRSAFYTGVMALYDTTKEQKYLDAATHWAEKGEWTPQTTPRHPEMRFADNQACTQVYAELYLLKPDERKIAPAIKMFDAQMADPKGGRVDWWWCDSLYMTPPALVRLAKATKETRYLDFMNTMWWDACDYLQDKETGLFYRDKRFFEKKTANGQKTLWSRGNGWVVAGTCRVLDDLPDDYRDRQKYIDLHKRMAAELIKLQREDGLWPPSLLDPKEFDSPETSGTAFFCYALAWGINHGTLDRATYLPHVIKAWNGLVTKVTPEGKLGYVQKVAGEPGKVNPDDTHEYAVGALLLAGSEILKIK